MDLRPESFFDLSECSFRDLFDGVDRAWDVIPKIESYVKAHLAPRVDGEVMEGAWIGADVYVGEGTVVEPGAMIKGPTIIGRNCEIRQGAYIRGGVLVGDEVCVGHTSEVKNAVLMNASQVPHFNYVGDSVFGVHAHLGAGVKISNLKITRDNVSIVIDGEKLDTGLRKFGVILGDWVEIGCNAVCNPGTVIGPRSLVYPNTSVSGYYPADVIVKLRQETEVVARLPRLGSRAMLSPKPLG